MSDSSVPKLQWLDIDPLEAFEDLRENSILSYFPDDFLDILSTFGETRMISSGEVILSEGAINSEFFFLLSGAVEILINDDVEYLLSDVGEVFGEMSLIAEAPCTATVRATEDSCMLVFNHSEINTIVSDNKEEFGYVLFHVFSKILTRRLTDANKTLHLVETQNKELTRLSREIEQVAHERFQEMWGKGNLIYDHLEKIYKEEICGLVEDLEKNGASDIDDIQQRISRIQKGSKPIFEYYKTERGIQSQRVLLVEPDKKMQRLIKTALVGAGVLLKVAESREEAFQALNSEPFNLLMAPPDLLEVAETAHSVNPEMKFLLLAGGDSENYASYLKRYPYIGNIVSLHENTRVFTLKNVFTSVGKIASNDLFGMEKYLNWGVDIQRCAVEGSEQRKVVLQKMEDYFSTAGLRSGVIDRCRGAAEEMLMNVVYDAPVDSKGNSRYNHMGRNRQVELEVFERGEFHFACDGVMAAIAVQDPFGGLDKEVLFEYLRAAQTGEEIEEPEKAGGGVGLHLIVETADLVVVNVREGIKTEVIALFNIDRKAEKFFDGSFFHMFYD